MQDFTGAELKVILFLIRRTYGFGKDDDAVSLSQLLQGMKERGTGRILNKGTGLTKKTLLQALTNLESQGHVIREQRRSDERGNEPTVYRLNIQIASLLELETGAGEQSELEKSTPPLGEKLHQGGGVKVPPSPRGKSSPTQNQRLQNQREQQDGGVV